MPFLRMPSTGVLTQPNYIGGYNRVNSVNDPVVGGPVASMGTGAGYTPGQLGNVIYLDNTCAKALSNTSYTLYGGRYQYVKFNTSAAVGNIVGWVAYSATVTSSGHTAYLVTTTLSTDIVAGPAGIALNTVTSGYYGWIFTGEGLCNVLYKTSPTSTTIGGAIVTIASNYNVDCIGIGAACATYGPAMELLGYAYQQPVSATVCLGWFY